MDLKISQVQKLKGEIKVAGDKSISHRAIIFAALAAKKSRIKGLLESEDCLNTINIFQKMGVKIEKKAKEYIVNGVGLNGLKEPKQILDCGNSGTSMRLITGLLSAQNFYSVLTGDDSLKSRPMDRIINPLSQMGAQIWGRDNNSYAPLAIKGTKLTGINYKSPVASAQVKSAILLAALYVQGKVVISEPGLSRDHTERMLQGFGLNISKHEHSITFKNEKEIIIPALDITVPADISSAAFFLVAGLIVPDSELLLKNIGLNPTRAGIITVIKKMGGKIELIAERTIGGELVADILVKSSMLKGIEIKGEIIPTLIDELPIIAILASQAVGKTIIKDAAELRVKETDRIAAMCKELKRVGIKVEELPDGMIIEGPCSIKGGVEISTYNDHRIAMSFAIAGLLAENKLIIKNSQCINTSFPNFINLIKSLT